MNTSFPPAEFDENPDRPVSIGEATEQLLGGGTLSYELTCQVFESMMTGRVHHAEIGALLGILATRVPTGDEIAGAATIMRKHVRKVETSVDRTSLLDTAGTGEHQRHLTFRPRPPLWRQLVVQTWPNMATSLGLVVAQRSFLRDWESTSRPRSKCKPDVSMSLVCVSVLPPTITPQRNTSCRCGKPWVFRPSSTCSVH